MNIIKELGDTVAAAIDKIEKLKEQLGENKEPLLRDEAEETIYKTY